LLDGGPDNDLIFGMDGNDSIAGGTGNDTLYDDQFVAGDDTLDGGIGDDQLYAHMGNDILNGGDGDDSFYLNNYGTTNANLIDFNINSESDSIRYRGTKLTGLASSGGHLAASNFIANASGMQTNANQRIMYNTLNGQMNYDTNTATTLNSANKPFATITNVANVTSPGMLYLDISVW